MSKTKSYYEAISKQHFLAKEVGLYFEYNEDDKNKSLFRIHKRCGEYDFMRCVAEFDNLVGVSSFILNEKNSKS